jgi:hypothetical protein
MTPSHRNWLIVAVAVGTPLVLGLLRLERLFPWTRGFGAAVLIPALAIGAAYLVVRRIR